jgi:hypothetical protein
MATIEWDFETAWNHFAPSKLLPGEKMPMLEAEVKIENNRPKTPGKRTRKSSWAIDFVIGGTVAVEIEGGVFSRGRHTRPLGFIQDCFKYNEITRRGLHLLRFETTHMLFADPEGCVALVLSVWRGTNNHAAS